MSRDFFKNYVKNLPNNFSSRENENTRLFENINKALKFLNKKLIEPGTRLLDLGSGNGSFYEYCLSKPLGFLLIDRDNNDGKNFRCGFKSFFSLE